MNRTVPHGDPHTDPRLPAAGSRPERPIRAQAWRADDGDLLRRACTGSVLHRLQPQAGHGRSGHRRTDL
nr:hypothetical protein [Tanacetum cinerariifolium]